MSDRLRAIFYDGHFVPLEPYDLLEGAEVDISVDAPSLVPPRGWPASTTSNGEHRYAFHALSFPKHADFVVNDPRVSPPGIPQRELCGSFRSSLETKEEMLPLPHCRRPAKPREVRAPNPRVAGHYFGPETSIRPHSMAGHSLGAQCLVVARPLVLQAPGPRGQRPSTAASRALRAARKFSFIY